MQTTCKHGERKRYEGVGKNGPYVAWFCPAKKGDPTQCKPEFEDKKKPQTAAEKSFNQGLEATAFAAREDKKDSTITRLALAKSLIEGGAKYTVETVKEFNRWLDLVEGRAVAIKDPNEEIETDNIPF